MEMIKWISASIGHIGLWCVLFNLIHATAWPRSTRKYSEKLILLAVVLPFVWIATLLLMRGSLSFEALSSHPLTFVYSYGCILLGCFFVLRWMYRKFFTGLPTAVSDLQEEIIPIGKQLNIPLLHGSFPKLLGRIPFNQALKLSQRRMTFQLDIPPALDGFRICQLSDLHFTGQIGREYFERVVEKANEFDPDLIVITGDLIDEMKCLDWIETTFAKLRAKCGVYYVLGNHDKRIRDESMLRERLKKAGLVQASGEWKTITHEGVEIQITGNELPWYKDVNRLGEPPSESQSLRILLSHSPDQLDWARDRKFDLMFAGHTHGGQIQLPIFGPIVAPSRHGVLYASGTFQIGEMIMHVSRGISGDEAIRLNCPPELGLFTLVAAPKS